MLPDARKARKGHLTARKTVVLLGYGFARFFCETGWCCREKGCLVFLSSHIQLAKDNGI